MPHRAADEEDEDEEDSGPSASADAAASAERGPGSSEAAASEPAGQVGDEEMAEASEHSAEGEAGEPASAAAAGVPKEARMNKKLKRLLLDMEAELRCVHGWRLRGMLGCWAPQLQGRVEGARSEHKCLPRVVMPRAARTRMAER